MVLDLHPFIKPFTQGGYYNLLPPQMVSYKEKYKDKDVNGVSTWMQLCMDSFERIARYQYYSNRYLIDNERLSNGEFVATSDYGIDCEDCDQFLDPLQELIAKGDLPHFIKHYDIISPVIKLLVTEFDLLPDTFHVVANGEKYQSDVNKQKTELVQEYVLGLIEAKFKEFLDEKGIQLDQKFETEEEQQQFFSEIEQLKKTKTPKEIGEYLKYDYRHIAEIWAEYELLDQKDRFNLRKLRREEFRDYLVMGRRFRHIKVTPMGLKVNSLNPINVFYHKSPGAEYIQDGEYVGQIFALTTSDVINNYGHLMNHDQIVSFESYAQKLYKNDKPQVDMFGNPINYMSIGGNPYNTFLPSFTPALNQVAPNLGMNWVGSNIVGYMPNSTPNMWIITEAYWWSYKKEGRLCWINPNTKIFEVIKVNEDFTVPDYVKELTSENLLSEPKLNTIVWTWTLEKWEGTKINHYTSREQKKAIYIGVRPSEYQGINPYNNISKKLPICGQISNNRNTRSTSFVDLKKPLQFFYNVLMNKAMKMLERSILPFIIADLNLLPEGKDWNGKNALIQWFEAGQESPVVPVNTAPSNTQGSAGLGGQYPKVIDVDITPRIIQYFSLANSVKMMSDAQLGFTPERLGDISTYDTATGIQTSVAKSSNMTASWFTDFYECERDILKIQLDVAQHLAAQNEEISAQFTRTDFTTAFLKFNNEDFDLYTLRLYIVNSQEELRRLEVYKQLALQNTNGALTSTRMEMSSMSNAERILVLVKEAEEKAQQQQDQLNQMKQQEMQATDERERLKMKDEREMFEMKLINDLKEAWITSRGFLNEGEQDVDKSSIPDAFEYEKFQAQSDQNYQKLGLDRDKNILEREKEQQRRLEKQAELNLKQRELNLKEFDIKQTAQNVKVLDKGKFKS